MRYLGIDPGVTGALAVIDVDGTAAPRVVACHDMPVTLESRANGKVVRRVDAAALIVLLKSLRPRSGLAFVEFVHASPGMGVSSAFSFGHTAGTIEACCAAAGIATRHCQPSAWKRALNVPADKDDARARAAVLLGDDAAAAHWPRKKDHGRAEAALLAYYGARVSALSAPIKRKAAA